MKRYGFLVCLLFGLELQAQEPAQPLERHPARLEWVDCWFESVWDRELHCAHFYPSRLTTQSEVRLPVVVIGAPAEGRRSSPILYMPGGPGMPAGLDMRGLQRWQNWVGNARWPHDLVLFDPRGTGLSLPNIDCPEIRKQDRQFLLQALSSVDDLKGLQQSAGACYQRLRHAGFQANDYSTERQVQDIGELMEALGGQDWNLYGISYGSRLALQVLRNYPRRVRSLMLDSVYPPEVNGLTSHPAQFARARENLLGFCSADSECHPRYPWLDKDLDALFRKLRHDPVLLKVEQWPDDPVTLVLNDYRLLWMLFLESYQPRYRPRLIPAITAAVQGNFELWQPIAADYLKEWLDPNFSQAVYLSVTCAEDMPGTTDASYRAKARQYPKQFAYLSEDWRLSPCHQWPVQPLPLAMRQAVSTMTVPVLLLNGRHDAATLPEWAQLQFARVANGHHVVFEGSSHGVTWENACAMAVAWEFLRDPRHMSLPPCLSEWERHTMKSHAQD